MHSSILPILLSLSALLPLSALAQTYETVNVELTFYSYVDNTDHDNGDCTRNCNDGGAWGTLSNAYTCPGRSGKAGGTGDESDPITAASSTNNGILSVCDTFYVPYLQKFFIYEDQCTDCANDPPHFDLFAGGSPSDNFCPNICSCEDQLTPSGNSCIFYDVDDSEGESLTVSSDALFDGTNCNFFGTSATTCS